MPRILKRYRGLFLFVMLFSVTARVFTGASEAQVNFTSLIVDQNILTHTLNDEHLLLHHTAIKSTDKASSIPDKHRTYATYKKYLTPDKSFAVDTGSVSDKSSEHQQTGYVGVAYIHNSIFLPIANSPPVDTSVNSHTRTSTADSSVVLENYFGKIAINNSAGGLGGYQL